MNIFPGCNRDDDQKNSIGKFVYQVIAKDFDGGPGNLKSLAEKNSLVMPIAPASGGWVGQTRTACRPSFLLLVNAA